MKRTGRGNSPVQTLCKRQGRNLPAKGVGALNE